MNATATKKISRRTASGEDKRGNSRDRAARKTYLLATFGNGETCPCVHCGIRLDRDALQADRIDAGGSYRRSNIQAACGSCNRARGNKTNWISPLMSGLAKAANNAAKALR